MKLVPVRKIPRQCAAVTVAASNIRSIDYIMDEMADLCEKSNGLGLAAPQVGIALQMIVIREPGGFYRKIINPKYFPVGDLIVDSIEGCLSLPNRKFIVKRFSKIEAHGTELDKGPKTCNIFWKELSGRDGIVWQHECQHVFGGLISDDGIEIV